MSLSTAAYPTSTAKEAASRVVVPLVVEVLSPLNLTKLPPLLILLLAVTSLFGTSVPRCLGASLRLN